MMQSLRVIFFCFLFFNCHFLFTQFQQKIHRRSEARGPHPWVGGVDVRKEILALKELPGTGRWRGKWDVKHE